MMTRILQAARNVMKSRVQVVEQTLRCVREHGLAHLTEHSEARRGSGRAVKSINVRRSS